MSLAIDPNETFEYVPITDRARPKDSQRVFKFRYVSADEADAMERKFDESRKGADWSETCRLAVEGLSIALVVGAGVVEANKLTTIASRADIVELRDKILDEMTLSEIEKKQRAFASPSTTDSSVK